MGIWAAIQVVWRELLRPSTLPNDATALDYHRGVIGMTHALVGAGLVAIIGADPQGWALAMSLRLGIGAIYYLVKEVGDLRRGGQFWDGAEDALMVTLGSWLWGNPWWPLVILVVGLALMISGALRRVR
jgi:hypothetical protein